MAGKDILLGIDFGSGGCKVTAIDTDGFLQGEASVEYRTHYPHPGALAAVREQGVDFKRIASIAFDGSTHNAVLMNGEMKPLRKTIMWTDQRSVEECAWLKQHHAAQIFATAWQMPTPTWTLPQLMWINRHEPEVIRATEHILFVKDYVRYLVTGVSATDYIEAQGTLFYDMLNQEWSEASRNPRRATREFLPELL